MASLPRPDAMRSVPNPTQKEIVTASILTYIKLPLLGYPISLLCGYMEHSAHEGVKLIVCGAIVAILCFAGLMTLGSMTSKFAERVHGKVTGKQFTWMYVGSGTLMILGALNLVDMSLLKGSVMGLLRGMPNLLLLPVTMMQGGIAGVAVSIALLIGGLVWFQDTKKSQKERCDHCGGFAYKVDERIPGTYNPYKEKETTTVETQLVGVKVTRPAVIADYEEKTTVKKVTSYTEIRRVTCRYCGKHFGDYQHDGETEETKTSGRYYEEWH